ncbi:transmembrane protein, putative, partial (macronuclear) [Tetrahymena thermophila SB210]
FNKLLLVRKMLYFKSYTFNRSGYSTSSFFMGNFDSRHINVENLEQILVAGQFFIRILFNKKSINQLQHLQSFKNLFQQKYGFLFYGYKRNFYLWEFLSMNLRLILVFLVQYFDEDILSRASLMLVFLYLYLMLLQKHK